MSSRPLAKGSVAFGSLAFALAGLAAGDARARGETAFVVTYRCDGGHWLAVGYPAYRDAAKAPIRLTWAGRTVLLAPVRSGSGARYASRTADLQWWSKGKDGFLNRLSDDATLVAQCSEA